MHAQVERVCGYIYARTHEHTQARVRAHARTHANTHTHTHTHTHSDRKVTVTIAQPSAEELISRQLQGVSCYINTGDYKGLVVTEIQVTARG